MLSILLTMEFNTVFYNFFYLLNCKPSPITIIKKLCKTFCLILDQLYNCYYYNLNYKRKTIKASNKNPLIKVDISNQTLCFFWWT